MKKSASSSTTDKYGLLFPEGVSPASIELECFYRNWPQENGGLGAYRHLANAIDLLWNIPRRLQAQQRGIAFDPEIHDTYIWNEWSELMQQRFCEHKWGTVTGPGACVSADTRIWNPITGKSPTIQDLYETQTAPVVQTLFGPEQAGIPFVEGIDDLFRVVLEDGSAVCGTSFHRVLTAQGYVEIGSLSIGSRLLSYEHVPLASISGACPSVRASNVRGFRKIVPNSQDDCRCEPYSYDERPHLVEGNDQSFSPSLACALERSRFLFDADDLVLGFLRNRPMLWSGPPSSSSSLNRDVQLDNRVSPLRGRGIRAPYDESFRPCGQFRKANTSPSPFSKPIFDYVYKHSNKYVSYPKVQQNTVVSICRTRKERFYDLTVPGAAHYFAEGFINHNSWKTTSAAIYGLARWYSSPADTVVIVVSTTLDGLRRRIWKEVTKFYRANSGGIGNLVQSRNCIQFIKGSDDAGIFGLAVDKGDIGKAVGRIIGFHARNMIVIVDEMQTVNEAIVEACVNLESGADNFEFKGLGNAYSHFDPHGRMSEPKDGWNSVTVESLEWETKRGICIHLDGLDSPNVKAGYDKYPGLLKQRDIDSTTEFYGENSPQFWQMRRGYWAPEGTTKTVLSETMLTKFRAMDKPIWITAPKLGAALDPAFEGGDRCTLRFPKCGDIEVDGQSLMVIDPGEYLIIKIDVTATEPIHYQIARQVKDECELRGIEANMFAYDATGEGGGLGSVFAREWSPACLGVEFGGRASTLPVSEINPRQCRDEYYNRVTELWFAVRTLVHNGQMRGLDALTAVEFCKREYDQRGMLQVIETKKDMKTRMGRSPDLADATAIAVELFRKRTGFMTASGVIGKKATSDFTEFAKKMDISADENNYLVEA